MGSKSHYTFMRIAAPEPSREALKAFTRKVNEQFEASSMKLYGNIEAKDLHPTVQKTLKAKVDNVQFETYIQQTAEQIALKAEQSTVDSLGNAVSSMSSEIELMPGQIMADVEDKTVHVGSTPPSGSGLYIGRLWQNTLTGEQLRWTGNSDNTARAYPVTKSGGAVSFGDLSDDRGLNVTVKTVAQQAGSGTPSPENVRAISGKESVAVGRYGKNIFMPGPTQTANGITKTVNADGSISLSGTASAIAFFTMILPVPVTGSFVFSANNPVGNENVWIRANQPGPSVLYDHTLAWPDGKSSLFTGTVINVVIRVDAGTVLDNFLLKPQLEIATADYEATPYEPYAVNDYTLTPSAPLYGLPGIEDEIGSDGHETHRTALKTLRGTDGFAYYSGPNRFWIAVPGMKQRSISTQVGMCSHAILGPYAEDGTVHISTQGGYIFFFHPTITSISQFNAWLEAQYDAGTPVQVLYELDVPITASVAPVQISGVDGVNNVTSDGTSMDVSYTGSGWALVSGDARRLYSSANVKVDENGLEIRQVTIDGKPVDCVHVIGADRDGYYKASTGEFIGGLVVKDGELHVAASALADPRVLGNLVVKIKTAEDNYENIIHAMILEKDGIEGGSVSIRVDGDDGSLGGLRLTGGGKGFSINGGTIDSVWSINPDTHSYTQANIIGSEYGLSEMFAVTSDDWLRTASVEVDTTNANEQHGIVRTTGHIRPYIGGGADSGAFNIGSTSERYRRLHTTLSVDVSSDARIKKDVKSINSDLIMRLKPRQYRLITEPDKLQFGLIAQEVKEALDECGIENADLYGDENPDMLSLRYEQFIAPLIAAVQSQHRRIESLEARLAALEARFTKEVGAK